MSDAKKLGRALLATYKGAYVLFRDSVFLGKRALAHVSCRITQADSRDLGIGKPSPAVIFAVRVSALLSHVNKVILVRTTEEMRGVAAFPIVAGMAQQVGGVFSVLKKPSDAMSTHNFAPLAGLDFSVPLAIKCALPLPTIVGAAPGDFFPKAVGKRSRLCGLMAAYKFSLLAWEFCLGYGLTAAASAKRGMIVHVDNLLLGIGQARDVCRVAWRFLLMLPVHYITEMEVR